MPSLQAGVAAASLNSFHSPHPHIKGSMDPQMTSGSGAASPSSSSVASTSTSNTNLPVRASCDECRRRKLKCDGNRETCDRCKASGVQCHYNVRARIGRPKGTTKAARAASVSTANGASPPGAAPSPPAAKKQRYTPPEVSNSLPASASSATSYLATIPVAPPGVDDPFKMLNVLPGTSSSSSYASNPFGVAPGSSNEPSALDSLELAAYLESLDRVKISSSDGLTAGMLQGGDSFGAPPPPPPPPSYLMASSAGTNGGFDNGLLLNDVNGSASSLHSQLQSTGNSSSSWWAGTILDEAVSYAVPSDLSWCHWNLDEGLMGTTPSSSSATSQQQQNGTTAASHHAEGEQSTRPVQQAAEWPRGAQEGMGNGHIETQEGGIVQGGPWPSAVALPQPSTPVAPKKSCCSSKANAETPQPVREASPKMKKGPCPRTGAASCCCSTTDSMSSPAKSTSTTKLDYERERPATSPGASASSLSPRVHCVPNPSGTGCTCLCQSDVCLLRVKRTLSPSSGADDGDTKGSRGGVGVGGSDEPLSLHLTLSASQAISASCACSSTCPTCAKPPGRADGEENSGGGEGVEGESAAAAAHRAKRYNASLLISLALQIYTRAVRILRDGFGISTGAGTSTNTSTGTALLGSVGITSSRPASSSSSSSLLPTSSSSSQSTVQIGSSYVPRPANAQRIALLAIRLELLDLEEGMARIWQMGGGGASANGASANGASSGSNGSSSNGTGSGSSTALLAPIDGLVISKLRGQLREMVGRVEGLERDWDKRRGAEGRAMP